MKPIMTIKQVNASIQNIKINGKMLDQAIQDTALSVIHHVEVNREVSLANKLFNAMPAGSRRNALAQWFFTFGMIAVNTDKASKKERPFIFDKEGTTNIEEAAKVMWNTMLKEKSVSEAFDPDKFINMMQAKLKKLAKEGNLPEDPRLHAIMNMQAKAVA